MVHGREGPRGALCMWVRDLGHFVCYSWKKINNMLLCVKIMLIWVCVMYDDEWKLYVGNIIIRNL